MHKVKGQSILEYTVLIMLIIVAVMVMGPYVVRSINAHFKIWQESIDDSVNDRMTGVFLQLPPDKCTCGALTPGQCGGHLQFQNRTCALNERYQYTPCTPTTCGVEEGLFREQCVADASCCSIYNACSSTNSIGSCCGTVPIPNPASPRTTTDPTAVLPALTNPNPNNLGGYCYYGEEVQIGQCNGLAGQPNRYACKPNSECKASCTGHLPTDSSGNPTAQLCPGTDQGLTQDTPITLIGCPNTTQTFTIPAVVHNGSNANNFTMCNDVGLALYAFINGTGCGNPGTPKSSCTAMITSSVCFPSPDCSLNTGTKCVATCRPGFLLQHSVRDGYYCALGMSMALTVAPIKPNKINNISAQLCSGTTVNAASMAGTGCGNPGTPGKSCTVTLW